MTQEQFEQIALAWSNEKDKWRVCKHSYDNIHILRSDGELHKVKGEHEGTQYVLGRCAKAVIQAYHSIIMNGDGE